MSYFLAAILIVIIYVGYNFYFKPKRELQRYAKLLRSLGYKIHLQSFAFFGLSAIKDLEIGEKLYKDAICTTNEHFILILM